MSDLGVWGKTTSPYHRGERALHERYGRLEEQTTIARRIHSPVLDEFQQGFLAARDHVVIGSIDDEGRPWASMLVGPPGFVNAPDVSTVHIDAHPIDGDRLSANMVAGSPMSMVAIDLATRRRIRANLTFTSHHDDGVLLHVDQAYGNCPKYIQTRSRVDDGALDWARSPAPETFTVLTEDSRSIIASADTFFVASHNNEDDQHDVGGVDVNHRGGRPGFVRVDGDKLVVPDYIGNFAFNTLGNFLINPVAGLLFVDFKTGDTLQLTGRVQILWEGDKELAGIEGAQRGWTFELDEGVLVRQAIPARWEFGEYSPATLRTGTWT